MNYRRRKAAGYQREKINRPNGLGINPLSASFMEKTREFNTKLFQLPINSFFFNPLFISNSGYYIALGSG